MKNRHDVIVVGARAAGASTAMLLARRGLRVLVLDRTRYGSDTLSTHALMRPAVMQLKRWGVLDAVTASGAPPIRRVTFHYPDEKVGVDIRPGDGVDFLLAPRRMVLDAILADRAAAAGATVRFGVVVDDLQRDARGRVTGVVTRDADGRRSVESADLVIGADGIRSVVAHSVNAPVTRLAAAGGAVVYGYFRGVPSDGYEWAYAPEVSAGVIPTNDGEVCVFVGSSVQTFRTAVQPDLARGFHQVLRRASPSLAARVAAGEQAARFRAFAGIRGYYRKPFGDGWALVGDAGYFRDPITTHGITDAFRDAELLARAVCGETALADYERVRDEVTRDTFDVTGRIASYEWTMDELRVHLRDLSRSMRAEAEVIAAFATHEAVPVGDGLAQAG